MEGDDEEKTTSIMDKKHKLESDKYLVVKKNDASINNNRQDNKSTFHCCPRRNKVKPKSEKQEKKENKFLLIVKLVGSVLEESDEGYSVESEHNLRNFLFKLINLLKKEDCCLVLPKGNNNTLYELVERIRQTVTKEYEQIVFSTEEDFLKLISGFRTLECLLVYNGDHMDEKEQEEYIKNNRNIIILKESENLTRFEEALSDKSSDVLKGKVLSKNYVTMNINQTWTETSIAQKILHSYLGKGTAEDFLLLCIRLNQLDLAVQHGGLWKFNSLDSKAKDENKLIRKQIVLFSKSLERFDFIKYLIQHGVKIKDYLERDDILDNTEKDKTHLKEIYLFQTKDEQGEQKKQKLRCDNYDKTNDQSSNTENDSKERDLYIYAIITENFKLAVLLWRTLSRPTIAALYAIEIINDLKALYKKDPNDHVSKLDQEIRNFENLAISTLNRTYATNPDIVHNLLIYKLKGSWKDYNCVDLALRNKLGKFLSQTPCIMLNEEMWNNSSVPRNNRFEHAKMETSATSNKNCCISIISELRAPRVIAFFRFISHLVFLGFFAIWIISFLAVDTLHWIEWALLIWVIFYTAEIVHQVMRHRRSCWSFIDDIELVSVLLFLISWILHIAAYMHQDNQQLMDCVLTLFSIDFTLFCIFTLEFCYITQSLGPRLIVFMEMAKILCQFLLIIFAFFIAFAVSSQAVLYPKTQLTGLLFFRIFKRPFWSVFGDFTLDELEPSECTSNASMYFDNEQLRCPSEVGSIYVPIIMGLYAIIVNILLFNLIIALFNSAIKTNEQQTEELWHRLFMSFTCKHSILFFMIPPITWLYCLLPEDENNRRYPFEVEGKHLEHMITIASIEEQQRDMYLIEVEDIKQNKVNIATSTVVSQDTYNYNTYNTFHSQEELLKLVQNDVTLNEKKLLEESTITSTTSITDNEFLSQSIGNYNKVTDKFQKRNKEEKTKISPKECCDKETETDSTKYNNEETKIPPKESCDKETETDSIKYNNEETKIPPKESCDKETETDSTKYNNEETKIPPKEICDKETETDSTKYNNEKTQEHCDIGAQTVIPEPMIAYKKKYRPLVGRISVSPDFPSTNRWVVKGLRVVNRRDMKDILSGFHKKKHSGYIEKVYRSYFSKRKLKDIRKVFNFPK
ncbi:transient receptor potential cation channel subfamily M member 1-like [Biomphalaria glabrata]|uniref:Transient receptor potential cation channel subfamily M member 1-like n=1 Tax=Biomphalaria glabrata TaxID=6526 RepID=A0A9W2YBI7_BIOGL|nr:transient receptor potential cation channel subfamily M member 1-like [Biomphalaria glabrata]